MLLDYCWIDHLLFLAWRECLLDSRPVAAAVNERDSRSSINYILYIWYNLYLIYKLLYNLYSMLMLMIVHKRQSIIVRRNHHERRTKFFKEIIMTMLTIMTMTTMLTIMTMTIWAQENSGLTLAQQQLLAAAGETGWEYISICKCWKNCTAKQTLLNLIIMGQMQLFWNIVKKHTHTNTEIVFSRHLAYQCGWEGLWQC